MALQPGKNYRIKIQTATPGTFVVINGLDTYNRDDSQNSTSYPTFDAFDNPFVGFDAPNTTITASGFFDPVDPGQLRARAVASLGDAEIVQFLWNGTDGFSQSCYVGSRSGGATASNAPQTWACGFAPDGTPPAVVGAGPLP